MMTSKCTWTWGLGFTTRISIHVIDGHYSWRYNKVKLYLCAQIRLNDIVLRTQYATCRDESVLYRIEVCCNVIMIVPNSGARRRWPADWVRVCIFSAYIEPGYFITRAFYFWIGYVFLYRIPFRFSEKLARLSRLAFGNFIRLWNLETGTSQFCVVAAGRSYQL